ncbi:alpha-tubulin assembly protein/Chaperone [Blumeria hordei DH14]|uniref:Alpha-tubulin assembly protein/Chaperone n=1 Tax=Blumeria graminis f. sp. hordei (strain DH14) TaxID=546991 RepID=N1JMV2_BLUG1|nr:alpha-tubulin assembly protein/Chaperone [Blumeria hordei DH14]
MARQYRIGDRLSVISATSSNNLCTVRYIGEADGFKGLWLGVEWDDDSRGKHDGSLNGKRYFRSFLNQLLGLCDLPAASFIRPSRPVEPERSLIEAIREKYAPQESSQLQQVPGENKLTISGKVVEEVGFDKIRQIQAQFHNLRVVVVPGMCISVGEKNGERIEDTCSKISDLDLSRNLIRDFKEVSCICRQLPNLKMLRLNGNRFFDNIPLVSDTALDDGTFGFSTIQELELDQTLLPWESIVILGVYFHRLTILTVSSNHFREVPATLNAKNLISLNLQYNKFKSLHDIHPLSQLESLQVLLLKGNQISKVNKSETSTTLVQFGMKLCHVDLSHNCIDSWDFIDTLPLVFPGLTNLRTMYNPIHNLSKDPTCAKNDDASMIIIGRLESLTTLNYSKINAAERANAEIYYLSKIAKEVIAAPENEKNAILARHARFKDLCIKWGEPVMNRSSQSSLDSRLIKFTFHCSASYEGISKEMIWKQEIPKSIDVYRVKGMIGKMLGVPLTTLRMVWETGEWDPVADYDNALEETDSGYTNEIQGEFVSAKALGRWVQREVEVRNSTRQIGNCVDGLEASIRVEFCSDV